MQREQDGISAKLPWSLSSFLKLIVNTSTAQRSRSDLEMKPSPSLFVAKGIIKPL